MAVGCTIGHAPQRLGGVHGGARPAERVLVQLVLLAGQAFLVVVRAALLGLGGHLEGLGVLRVELRVLLHAGVFEVVRLALAGRGSHGWVEHLLDRAWPLLKGQLAVQGVLVDHIVRGSAVEIRRLLLVGPIIEGADSSCRRA